MLEDYKNALKSGQRAYRACVARGQSPYLAVLDDILVNVNIVAQEPLGLVEIPAESIVGTKTSGRHTAFAPNFMPLLEPDTEFAGKWSNLCDAHLEEGIHTPIIAYEFLNKFYVQEGNKRVSVLKYFDAVRIAGTVTRLIPERNDSLENRIYYEFLDFYKLSKVNDVHFSRLGGYAKLQTLVCKASGESWTDDDRLSFSSFYTMFRQQFLALGGGGLNLTAGDAMLVYLSVYRYADACESTPSQMKQNLELSGNQIHDTHRRFLECQKVIIQIERPALVTMLPHQLKGKTVVLDLGANVDCDSTMLVQFAIMGAVLAEEAIGIKDPRVALLNIGEEEMKGLSSIRDAAAVLKTLPTLNYIGYLEANELLTGKTDVLVCDGFTGNVTLKTMEGVVRMFLSLLKSQGEGKKRSWWLLLLKRWLQKSLARRFSHLNPDQYNGACLLGLRGTVIKSHGAANQRAFAVAIEQAVQAVQRQVPQRIAARLESLYPAGFELPEGGRSGNSRPQTRMTGND